MLRDGSHLIVLHLMLSKRPGSVCCSSKCTASRCIADTSHFGVFEGARGHRSWGGDRAPSSAPMSGMRVSQLSSTRDKVSCQASGMCRGIRPSVCVAAPPPVHHRSLPCQKPPPKHGNSSTRFIVVGFPGPRYFHELSKACERFRVGARKFGRGLYVRGGGAGVACLGWGGVIFEEGGKRRRR